MTNKPWPQTETFGFSANGIITKLKNIVNKCAPVCYQDETGFHTGVKSPEKPQIPLGIIKEIKAVKKQLKVKNPRI